MAKIVKIVVKKSFRTVFFFVLILFVARCITDKNYVASRYLSATEQRQFIQNIIFYIGDLPQTANHRSKFDQKYNDHYSKQLERFRLDKYFEANDGYIYFEVSRLAPSFKIKRVATGGRLKYDSKNTIIEYEELYRTWKMSENDLELKTAILFQKMINGEDLSPYYTANSSEEYIEFPDDMVTFNKDLRCWVSKNPVFPAL